MNGHEITQCPTTWSLILSMNSSNKRTLYISNLLNLYITEIPVNSGQVHLEQNSDSIFQDMVQNLFVVVPPNPSTSWIQCTWARLDKKWYNTHPFFCKNLYLKKKSLCWSIFLWSISKLAFVVFLFFCTWHCHRLQFILFLSIFQWVTVSANGFSVGVAAYQGVQGGVEDHSSTLGKVNPKITHLENKWKMNHLFYLSVPATGNWKVTANTWKKGWQMLFSSGG